MPILGIISCILLPFAEHIGKGGGWVTPRLVGESAKQVLLFDTQTNTLTRRRHGDQQRASRWLPGPEGLRGHKKRYMTA